MSAKTLKRALSLGALIGAGLALTTGLAFANPVAITGGKVIALGQNGIIDGGTVVVDGGKIIAVGKDVKIPAGAKIIDAKGKIVAPGFIAVDSGLTAVEVSSLGSELGTRSKGITASFDPSYGLDPESSLIPAARLGGLTRAIVIPAAGNGGAGFGHEHDTAGASEADHASPSLFGGQAVAVDLGSKDGFITRGNLGVSVAFGGAGSRAVGGSHAAVVTSLKAMFEDVRFFIKNRASVDKGASRALGLSRTDLEALIPVVQGREPLIVDVSRASDIKQAIAFAKSQKVKIIVNGGEEGWRVAPELAAAGVPVILNPISNLPDNFDALGTRLENAKILKAAGVLVILKANENAMHRAREARYNAGNAVANGLSYQAALEGLTLAPAKAFGLSDKIGSLEVGKDADVVVWSGDPLEPLSQPEVVLIRGQEQNLMSRGRKLAERYKAGPTDTPPAYSY